MDLVEIVSLGERLGYEGQDLQEFGVLHLLPSIQLNGMKQMQNAAHETIAEANDSQ